MPVWPPNRLVRLIQILLLALGVAAVAPACALASFPGKDGVIAYATRFSIFTESTAIWALEPATGDQLQLTSGPDDNDPAFSPSGNQLAFDRTTMGTSTIFIARADGSDARPLVEGSEPAFSPDGRKLVFARPTGLFVTGAQPGSAVRRLTSHPEDSEPSWGPNGEIVFERTRVLHMNSGGSTQKRFNNELDMVTPGRRHVSTLFTYEPPPGLRLAAFPVELHPDWSPHGKSIVLSICNVVSQPRLPTVPALVLQEECVPSVWAPNGHGFAVPKLGVLRGRPGTNCPHIVTPFTELAWQPVHVGTLHVPTVPCEPQPGPPEGLVEPSEAAAGSITCYTIHHRRKCHVAR